jgi:cytochrome c oxidase subunit 2
MTTSVTRIAGFFGSLLLFAFPLVSRQSRDGHSTRIIEVRLSRYAFAPERIEMRLGERVRLNIVSVDSAHGFQVRELGLNIRPLMPGKTVAVDMSPAKAGRFQISCSEYCGAGHHRMKAWLIVTPGA